MKLLDGFPVRWTSSIAPNDQYDTCSKLILDRVVFLLKMLSNCVQQHPTTQNSSCSDTLESLQLLIHNNIFQHLRFNQSLLSAANCGNINVIDTLLPRVLEISGLEKHIKIICEPLSLGSKSSNRYNTMLTRAVLAGDGYAQETIACLIRNLDQVTYLSQDKIGSLRSYFLDQQVQCAPNKHHTALHITTENNESVIVEYLLTLGADPNILDSSGETPLHVAVQNNNFEIIKLLLNHGVNPNILDSSKRPDFYPKLILDQALNARLVNCQEHILDPPKAILLAHLQTLKMYVEHSLEQPLTKYDPEEELLLVETIKQEVSNVSNIKCPLSLPTNEILIWLELYKNFRTDTNQRTCDSVATCASGGTGHAQYYPSFPSLQHPYLQSNS